MFGTDETKLIESLYPAMREDVKKFLIEAKKINARIFEGYRTGHKQNEYFKRKPVVTYATAGKSWHNYGFAFDVCFVDENGNLFWNATPEQWETLGKMGESFGFHWGGRWKTKDCPHFERNYGMTIDQAYETALELFFDQKSIGEFWGVINAPGHTVS